MSSRTVLRPEVVIDAGSMAGDLTSSPTILQSLSKCSYEVSWTGTSPVGTMSVEASNSYSLNPDGTVRNAGTWTTMELQVNGAATPGVGVTGNTGSIMIDITNTGIYAIRAVYTRASGTGTLTAIVSGKVA